MAVSRVGTPGSPFGSARGTSPVARSCNCMPPDSRFRCKLHARYIGVQVSLAEYRSASCRLPLSQCRTIFMRRVVRSALVRATAIRDAGVSQLHCRSLRGVPAGVQSGALGCAQSPRTNTTERSGALLPGTENDLAPVPRCAVAATGVVLIAPDVLKRTRMAAYMRPDQGQSGLWSAPVEREIDTETCG